MFFVAQTDGLLLLGVARPSNPLSEIAIELRLGFQIPESGRVLGLRLEF
jgi:hypothetical protein